jgi:serine/threonine-protein kinase HipA
LIKKYIPAWRVEIEKCFSLVVFNYLFSNGDAHLKNFAALESIEGDYLLSPAYDLIDTRLHVDDTYFALKCGLIPEELRSAHYKRTGSPVYADFLTFAREIGVSEKRMEKLLKPFCERRERVEELIDHSYLNDSAKKGYLIHYNTRRKQLNK